MIALTGSQGQLGRLVVDELQRRAVPFRALTRDPDSARLTHPSLDARRADFDDPRGLIESLDGVERLLLISTPDDNATRLRRQRAAIDAARQAGVRHVLYLSFLAIDPGSPFPFAVSHGATEGYLAQSGLTYTLLRPSLYLDSLAMVVPELLATGVFHVPAGEGRVSFLARADLAAIAAQLLVLGQHEGQTLALTGAMSLSYAEVAAQASARLGREVRYVAIDEGDYRRRAAALGPWLEPFVAIWRTIREGHLARTTGDATTLLGRPPQDVTSYLQTALAT